MPHRDPNIPGHHLNEHGLVQRIAASRAPISRLEHENIQPPSHQRHTQGLHPSEPLDHDHPANGNAPIA